MVKTPKSVVVRHSNHPEIEAAYRKLDGRGEDRSNWFTPLEHPLVVRLHEKIYGKTPSNTAPRANTTRPALQRRVGKSQPTGTMSTEAARRLLGLPPRGKS